MIFKYGCAMIAAAIIPGVLNLSAVSNGLIIGGIVLITTSIVLLIGKFMP